MKKATITIFFICVIGLYVAQAQNPTYKSGISFKALFMDYQSQNGGEISDFKTYHTGFEVGYHRTLTNNLSVNVPLKVGVVQSHEPVDHFHKLVFGGDIKLNYQFYKPTYKIIPYVLAGVGSVSEDDGEFNTQIPVGLGLHIKVSDKAYINWQSEYRPSLSDDRNNFHHALGFVYLFGKKPMDEAEPVIEDKVDSDGDGLIDDVDLCPQVAGPVELNGCPDTDGDGVADFEDACPEFAGLIALKGCPDTDGDGISDNNDECPNMAGPASMNGCPDNDRDNDGIPNNLDKCPDVAGAASNDGCPVFDSDEDGVTDDKDRCPNEAGTVAAEGCPDRDGDGVADFEDKCPNSSGPRVYGGCPDTDGDGIDDSRDRCPNTAGTVDNQGCPQIAQEDKQVLDIAMRAVQFDTGRSTLKPESYNVLNQIVDILRRYPDFSLAIEGHTDSTGGSQSNQRLSERRAKACFDYLASQGVSLDRMSHTGFGESRPIASNSTLSGRSLNRRVEFTLNPSR